ncbi:uncharacterized protein N7482_003869 [Penicillium canariense]|uniref:Uncharacterized protein n=1 Tax=Penicillium canariense TaxID=189055 RepID=A0A9W9I817_9EURO|nr:uncharacterized protein N7482_003869 [Penicillium canariense]KAJ5168275.1 hypothetical protein N7482_003869 [Penicillium canariense]
MHKENEEAEGKPHKPKPKQNRRAERRTPTVTEDKCRSAQINQVIVKNMQKVVDTSTMKCQHMEEFEVPWSQCHEGLGIVMKDNDSADTGLA